MQMDLENAGGVVDEYCFAHPFYSFFTVTFTGYDVPTAVDGQYL